MQFLSVDFGEFISQYHGDYDDVMMVIFRCNNTMMQGLEKFHNVVIWISTLRAVRYYCCVMFPECLFFFNLSLKEAQRSHSYGI